MLSNIRNLNRWQAFSIHLGISGLIFLALLSVIVFIWYPGVFIHMGGWQGIKIVAGVDLVLGPLLTVIVFNPKKKSLIVDLTVVWLLQISGLIYGIYTIDSQRPILQLLLDDTLYIFSKSDFREQNIPHDFLGGMQGPFPKFALLETAPDHSKIAVELVASQFSGTPMQFRTEDYIDLRNETQRKANHTLIDWATSRLLKNEKHGCYTAPIQASHASGNACIDAKKGMVDIQN